MVNNFEAIAISSLVKTRVGSCSSLFLTSKRCAGPGMTVETVGAEATTNYLTKGAFMKWVQCLQTLQTSGTKLFPCMVHNCTFALGPDSPSGRRPPDPESTVEVLLTLDLLLLW